MSALSQQEIQRYSRQLILPEIGVNGQLKLRDASVLIVGAGGLGCPVAIYLASAGVGKIGIVDYDIVEQNNLHRQISHTESTIGMHKTISLSQALRELNSGVVCLTYECQLSSHNAIPIISQYAIVVDATDNVATRYLLNDACVMTKRPLVSGSALRFEGQLTVYNHKGGPCHRCLFPKPPPPEAVTNCSDGGVIGSVPGVIGCLQSLEVIKLIVGLEVSYSQKMFIFDGLTGMTKVVRLRPRQPSCAVCGDNPTVTVLIDYEQFCGAWASDKDRTVRLLSAHDRILCEDYKKYYADTYDHLLLDVRPKGEFDMCKLPGTTNFPMSGLKKAETLGQVQNLFDQALQVSPRRPYPVFVVCRRGNDSQIAVDMLKSHFKNYPIQLRDLQGGLVNWSEKVDNSFPIY